MTILLLAACASQPPLASPQPSFPEQILTEQTTPTPALSADARLRQAFRLADPNAKRAQVLSAAEALLRDAAFSQMEDEAASSHFTVVAFSSERLIFSDPAFVRRKGNLAVVGMPDGLGLFLYDLSTTPGTPPLELSHWTAGLSAVEVTWRRDEIGVSFVTLGNDGLHHVHYVLAGEAESVWQVMWFSDEEPDWWFNATNATLAVKPNLSQLIVVGEASHTTLALSETEDSPRRKFRVEWRRGGDGYILSPPMGSKSERQNWLWRIAQPSAYTTLVEFIERLQRQDIDGAAHLVTDEEIISSAVNFGLFMPERRYEIVAYSEGIIMFRDRRGAFAMAFKQPQTADAPWLIAGLVPVGVELPTPTVTPVPIAPN